MVETVGVIITEIIICLVLAWSLGFLLAWILFNKALKAYKEEIDILEENLHYSAACNKNQEREIIQYVLKVKSFEKSLHDDLAQVNKKAKKDKHNTKNSYPIELKRTQKELDMLKSIEENLHMIKK